VTDDSTQIAPYAATPEKGAAQVREIEVVLEHPVRNEQDAAFVGDLLRWLAAADKHWTAHREAATKDLTKELERRRLMYRPLLQGIARLRGDLQRLLEGYLTERRQAQAALLAAAAEAPAHEYNDAMLVVRDAAPPKLEGITTKTVVDMEVVDEALVPDRFWLLDHRAVLAAVQAGEAVPGVRRIEREIVVRVSGGGM